MMLTKSATPGLKQSPYWQNLNFWLWLVAGLIAALVFGSLLLFTPKLQTRYLPNQFNKIVADGQERGFFNSQTDDAGNSYVWTQGKSYILFDFPGLKPLEMTFEIRSAAVAGGVDNPVTILANGVEVAKIQADPTNPEFQNLSVKFTPPPTDVQQLKIELVTPTFRPNKNDSRALGIMLKSVAINKNEAWAGIEQRMWLIWLLPLLALIVLVGWGIGNRSQKGETSPPNHFLPILHLLTLASAIVGFGLGAGATLILSGMGIIDKNPYSVWLVGCIYLTLFFGAATINLPLGKPDLSPKTNLWSLLVKLWQAKIAPRPTLTAILTLTAANFGLMVLFYGVIIIQNGGCDNLGRFWDGPEYLVNAKTLYDSSDPILQLPAFFIRSQVYWTTHFPGYSLLIRLVAPLFGYVSSMFVINFGATVIFGVALYRLLRDFGYSRQPLWIAVLALFLPLRWLIYHSVGASEALTLMFLVLAVYAFKQERWWLAGLWGAGVVVTRPNGFFLLAGFGLFLVWEAWRTRLQPTNALQLIKNLNWRAVWGLLPMPLALVTVFGLFGWRYGDFWAYLHIPESVTHLYPLPLLSLDISYTRSEGTFYYYILQAAGLVLLWRRKQYDIFWVGLVFFLPTVFMLHDDVIRYALPAFPFVLAIPFAPVLETKYARWFAPLALLGVLIYSWSQLNTNLIDLESWRQMQNILK